MKSAFTRNKYVEMWAAWFRDDEPMYYEIGQTIERVMREIGTRAGSDDQAIIWDDIVLAAAESLKLDNE